MQEKAPALERYILKSKLGEGGFGQVYLAWDQVLHRTVAIKVLTLNQLSILEGKLLARFNHPHIVHLHDSVKADALYLVMEYVPGPPLLEQQLTLEQILDLGIQVCTALDEIHRQGFVHQDIKPQNILRDPTTNVCKLIDFGTLAHTQLGPHKIVGTPKYIAPEQRQGHFDARTDIYALAVVLRELITVNQISQIPLNLTQILAKASSNNANERYASASELAQQLKEIKQEMESAQTQALVVNRSKQHRQRHAIALINALVAGTTLLLLLQLPLIQTSQFYQPLFAILIAPCLAAVAGFMSMTLACLLISIIFIAALLASWPTLAVMVTTCLIFLAPLIYIQPFWSLCCVLVPLLMPNQLLMLPVLAGYHYRAGGAVKTALFTSLIRWLADNLALTQSYQKWYAYNLAAGNIGSAWEKLRAVSSVEVHDIIQQLLLWINHPHFTMALIGILMGVGAAWIGKRGNFGLVMYVLATGAALVVSGWQYLFPWAVAVCSLLLSIVVINWEEIEKTRTI